MSVFVPTFRFETFAARDFRVFVGANDDDAIGSGDAALAGDIYILRKTAVSQSLLISDYGKWADQVAQGSMVGMPGDSARITDFHTLMGPKGDVVELLLLTLGNVYSADAHHILPLAPLVFGEEYELIKSGCDHMPARFKDVAAARNISRAPLVPRRHLQLHRRAVV